LQLDSEKLAKQVPLPAWLFIIGGAAAGAAVCEA
jgi:hypothetical protein